jgi:hypothetical protein
MVSEPCRRWVATKIGATAPSAPNATPVVHWRVLELAHRPTSQPGLCQTWRQLSPGLLGWR